MDPKWTPNGPKMDPKWTQNGPTRWQTYKRIWSLTHISEDHPLTRPITEGLECVKPRVVKTHWKRGRITPPALHSTILLTQCCHPAKLHQLDDTWWDLTSGESNNGPLSFCRPNVTIELFIWIKHWWTPCPKIQHSGGCFLVPTLLWGA